MLGSPPGLFFALFSSFSFHLLNLYSLVTLCAEKRRKLEIGGTSGQSSGGASDVPPPPAGILSLFL